VPDVEQLQRGWLDLLHTADRERVREEWRVAVRAGRNLDTELRIRSARGTYCWFKTRAVPIRDASGAVVRWYGSNTDIDQLKRIEDRFAVVLASIRDGFIGVDKDLVVIAINPLAERMLGCRAQEVVGHLLLDGGPAMRELVEHLHHGPAESEFPLRAVDATAQVQRNQEGGYLMFLRPPEAQS
jgi:PAS domain-containing protein